ncbi:hypothetical protein TI39_contig5888g00002 [Zymoseptoria brevis]|uniref:Uncharacterized protein n=1 Tax=Zymoseptoria brevis TaxID=1047168 RepID=A0A0F4G7J6_9PEZI|nr:hypothetical protein TI39_contig5888g00002 [Zymoseptoria brevis]
MSNFCETYYEMGHLWWEGCPGDDVYKAYTLKPVEDPIAETKAQFEKAMAMTKELAAVRSYGERLARAVAKAEQEVEEEKRLRKEQGQQTVLVNGEDSFPGVHGKERRKMIKDLKWQQKRAALAGKAASEQDDVDMEGANIEEAFNAAPDDDAKELSEGKAAGRDSDNAEATYDGAQGEIDNAGEASGAVIDLTVGSDLTVESKKKTKTHVSLSHETFARAREQAKGANPVC